jgi:hypothetical protein
MYFIIQRKSDSMYVLDTRDDSTATFTPALQRAKWFHSERVAKYSRNLLPSAGDYRVLEITFREV